MTFINTLNMVNIGIDAKIWALMYGIEMKKEIIYSIIHIYFRRLELY